MNEAKNTYGTGAFILLNTGSEPMPSEHGLLTTVAYKLGPQAATQYALEGDLLFSWPADLLLPANVLRLGKPGAGGFFCKWIQILGTRAAMSNAVVLRFTPTTQGRIHPPPDGKVGYEFGPCRTGAIAIAGAGISWLRDGLGIIETAEQSEELAATVEDTAGVVFVPAFR